MAYLAAALMMFCLVGGGVYLITHDHLGVGVFLCVMGSCMGRK